MSKSKFVFIIIAVTILLTLTTVTDIHAQDSIKELIISGIDVSEFPDVRLILQATGLEKRPITDLLPQSINVKENGKPIEFSLTPYTAGVRVIFLIDCGQGINSRGATGDSNFSEMKSVIGTYISRMNAADSVMILIQEGQETHVVSEYSSSVSDLQSKLDGYICDSKTASHGYRGISSAISLIQDYKDGKMPFIVFLSQGIQYATINNFEEVVSELASVPNLTLHTVYFFGGDLKSASRLEDLAKAGHGIYTMYRSKTSEFEMIDSIIEWRKQYLVAYRSSNSDSGNRHIVVASSDNDIPATIDYSVIIQSPEVILQEPLQNSTISRKSGETIEGNTDTDTDFVELKILINWLDGYPRNIVNVSLLANNQTQLAVTNPEINDGIIIVPWDLRAYNQVGQNSVSLQIQVTDELNLTGTSAVIPMIVLVESDMCNGLPDFLCSIVTFVMPLTNFLAIGIAIVALILVFVFRKPIVAVGQIGSTKIAEFITRVTKRRTSTTPKAILTPIGGIDQDAEPFEIFGTTPIGRSRKHAELIFQSEDENSPISRLHCTILDEDGEFFVRDEDSEWGTYLNGKRLDALDSEPLHDGDEIELAKLERGGIRFRFNIKDFDTFLESNDNESATLLDDPFSNPDKTDDDLLSTKPSRSIK